MSYIQISGMSALTPLGLGIAEPEAIVKQNLSQIPDVIPADYGWKNMNRFSRAGKYACLVVGEALAEAGLARGSSLDSIHSEQTALVIGNNHTNLTAIADLQKEAAQFGMGNVNPAIFPDTVLNVIGGYLSIYYKIRGTNTTISNGNITEPKALIYAASLLEQGMHDRVVVCMVHLFPPSYFRSKISSNIPFYESVSAIVLDRKDRVSEEADLLQIEFGETTNGSNDRFVQPTQVLSEILNRTKQQFSSTTKLVTSLGEERNIGFILSRSDGRRLSL